MGERRLFSRLIVKCDSSASAAYHWSVLSWPDLTHFAAANSNPPAPEWKYDIDGSSVIGARDQASPVTGAIPELLLHAIDSGPPDGGP